jgi:transcriptional regulator with XRE-family HTH domain
VSANVVSAQGESKMSKPNAEPDHEQIGQSIRRRRKALGKTLVEVAQDTELTVGFISQVERGICVPSLSSFMRSANALNTTIEQLLNVREDYEVVTKKEHRQNYSLGEAGRWYEKLGPGFAGALFYPCIIHRPPGHVSERMHHAGEVFCYLIAGELEYHLGDKVHHLVPGDSIHHDTNEKHFSKVISDTESVELWVSSHPIAGH